MIKIPHNFCHLHILKLSLGIFSSAGFSKMKDCNFKQTFKENGFHSCKATRLAYLKLAKWPFPWAVKQFFQNGKKQGD